MKPPPPMLPAKGCVTASANAVATAASTALPPMLRMSAPMSEASPVADTTTPVRELTPKSEESGLVWVCAAGPETPGDTSRNASRATLVKRMEILVGAKPTPALQVLPSALQYNAGNDRERRLVPPKLKSEGGERSGTGRA